MISKRRYGYVIIILIVTLIVGNPGEKQYLKQVVVDFGKIHHGMSLDISELATIGKSEYYNYLFFSTYKYTFGNISVSYAGIVYMKFYLGSSTKENSPASPLKST